MKFTLHNGAQDTMSQRAERIAWGVVIVLDIAIILYFIRLAITSRL